MKERIGFIIGVVVMAAFVAGPALADGMGGCVTGQGAGQFHKDKKAAIARELNLTPEQDKLLKDAKTAHRAEMTASAGVLKEKRRQLKEALAKPGVTKQQLEPIAAEMKQLQSQMVDSRIDGILKVKAILTPEQFQKLESMKEGRHKEGRGKYSEKD